MGSYRIEWKRSALRELKRLDRQTIPRIVEAIESLGEQPFPPRARKLQGSGHTYRIRVGDYRVIYDVFEAGLLIQVVRVRHRKNAYRE